MRRRYLTILIFILSLLGAYFLFFSEEKVDYNYNYYLETLISREEYEENIKFLDLEVEREDNSYIFTFTNPSEDLKDLKILIVDKENKYYDGAFPSFGILSYQKFTLKQDSDHKGINLVMQDYQQVNEILILISHNNKNYYYHLQVGE